MTILQAVILGIVQGITEFLPISSTAHLHLVPRFFGWADFPFVFDTSLHLGTALAIVIYFLNDFKKTSKKMWSYILLGSIPVMLAGFFFDDLIESTFTATFYISLFLSLGSLLMYLAEKQSVKAAKSSTVSLKTAMIVGFSQILALFPGFSRSGTTISFGLFSGLSREEAARFSFMLSTPAVVAAGLYKLLKSYSDIPTIGYTPWIIGVVVSFVVGYLAIDKLMQFLKTKTMVPFILYRLGLVALLVFTQFFS